MKNSSQQQTNIDKTERTNIFTPLKKVTVRKWQQWDKHGQQVLRMLQIL